MLFKKQGGAVITILLIYILILYIHFVYYEKITFKGPVLYIYVRFSTYAFEKIIQNTDNIL